MDRLRGEIGSRHHRQGCQRKRQNILQEHPYPIAYQATGEILPYEQPDDVQQHVGDDHRADAPMPYQNHRQNLNHTQGKGHPKISTRLTVAHHQTRHELAHRNDGTTHAENLQQEGTRQPFFGDSQDDKLPSHHSKSQHQREGDECREADQLAQGFQLASRLLTKIYQHRLSHRIHHSLYHAVSLEVPLRSLVVITRIMRREVMTQQDIQHIVVDMRGDGGSQQFAAELEHPADRFKIEPQTRAPRRIMPEQHRIHDAVNDGLGGQSPIRHATKRHDHSYHTRKERGDDARLRPLLHHHVLEEISRLSRTEAGE